MKHLREPEEPLDRLGLCLHDMPGGPVGDAARAVTSNVVYIRFHGATGRYAGR